MKLFLLIICLLLYTKCVSACYVDSSNKSHGIEFFSSIRISNLDEASFNLDILGDETANEITLSLSLSLDAYPHVNHLLEDSVWNVEISSSEVPQTSAPITQPPTVAPTFSSTEMSTYINTNGDGVITSSTRSGSSANSDFGDTLLMLFSSSDTIIPSLSLSLLSIIPVTFAQSTLGGLDDGTDSCSPEINAVLTVPAAYIEHGVGSFEITEETSSEIIIEYVCNDNGLIAKDEFGVCTACGVAPCGQGICIPGNNLALYDCDCGDLDYYLIPSTGLPSCSNNEFIIGFNLSQAQDNTITLPFSFSTEYDTTGYPTEVLDLVVDWGDRTTPEAFSGSSSSTLVSHTYSGDFSNMVDIHITGRIDRFNFDTVTSASREAFIVVANWYSLTILYI